jgi:hypothetical protein
LEIEVVPETSLQVAVNKNETRSEALGRTDARLDSTGKRRTLNRALQPDAQPIYEVAALFKQRCLQQDTSLLWPASRTWTIENLAKLEIVFLSNPAQAGHSFYRLWRNGLAEQSEDVHCIAADIVALYYLFPADLSGEAKLRTLSRVIRWRSSD